MKESTNFTNAEKLFERGKYSEAKQLFLEQKTPEANFYLALMAEKGLGEEINKDLAKDLYEQAFDEGITKAGAYLARIYQKEGSEADAARIYSKIEKEGMSTQNDALPVAYAKYRLARIDSANSFTPLTEKRKKLINDRYTDAITLYNKLDPGSRAHAKTIYHQALFKLKLSENDRNILPEARKLLKQAAEMDYNLAKAEVLIMDSNSLIHEKLRTKSFARALANSDKALELDPKNIRAKLLKSKALMYKADDVFNSGNREQAMELYDLSRILAQEISASNTQAKQQEKILDRKLAEIMKEKCNSYLSESISTITPTMWARLTRHLPNKAPYLKELSKAIESAIETNSDFLSKASFREASRIAQKLSNDIFSNNEKLINTAIEKDADTALTKDAIKLSAVEIIQNWTNLKKVEALTKLEDIDSKDQKLLDKRQRFQEKIEANFTELYHGLKGATDYPPKYTINIDDSWFEKAAGLAQDTLPFFGGLMGPILGGHWVGLAATGSGKFKKQLHQMRQDAVTEGARKFCEIGDRDINKAQKHFKEVAHELVNIYGMQIDNVDPESIDRLAKAAVDKMVSHVTTGTASYKELINLPELAGKLLTYAAKKFSNEEKVDVHPVKLLLTGIVEGESPDKKVKIHTMLEGNKKAKGEWLADGIFERTAITNGEKCYEIEGVSTSSKYGYRYLHNIPSKYSEIKKPFSAKLKTDLQRHKELMILANKKFPVTKSYGLATETYVDKESSRKEERELYKNRIVAVIIGVTGLFVIGLALVTVVGVSAGMVALPWIAEAVTGTILGGFLCYQSGKLLSKTAISLQTVDERHTHTIEKEMKPEISKEQLKAQHKSFVEKLESKAKPSYKFTNNLSHQEKPNEISNKLTPTLVMPIVKKSAPEIIPETSSPKTTSHRARLEKSTSQSTSTKAISHRAKLVKPTSELTRTKAKSHVEKEKSKKAAGKDLTISRMRSKY